MKKFFTKLKTWFKNNYLQLIFLAVILAMFFIFCFDSHILRMGLSFKSFGLNMSYYVQTIFSTPEEPISTLDMLIEHSGGSIFDLIDFDFQNFFNNFIIALKLIINPTFLKSYFRNVGDIISTISFAINPLLLLCLMIFGICKLAFRYKKNDEAKETKSLKRFKKIKVFLHKNVFSKIKKFLSNFFSPTWFKNSLIFLILVYFQIITSFIDLFSNYTYWCANPKNLMILGDMVILCLVNILPMYFKMPLIIRLLFIYWIFDKIRMNRAYKRLSKLSQANNEFMDDTGNIILISGASRTGKSAFLTQLTIQYEKMIFRPTLVDIMMSIERKFPKFNWNKFAVVLDNVPNLETQDKISDFISKLMKELKSGHDRFKLFDEVAPPTYTKWDNLTIESIFNALNDYAICYVFYNFEDPVALGNYPISFNSSINEDPHYFNVDHFDIFKETSDDYLKRQKYCHAYSKINNFDYLKLGIKTNPSSTNNYVPDLGAYSFTEMGKERGSTDTVKTASAKSKTGNRKNDKFNERLRIWSHISTIRYKTLFKVIMDEQDVKGINSDLRKTSETILTLDRKKKKRALALPCWSFEQTVCKWILQKYDNYNLKRHEIMLKSTLLNYFIKVFVGHVNDYYMRRINNFSYTEYMLYNVNGSLADVNESVGNCSLYLFDKIAYSGRYASTMLRRLFLGQMRKSNLSFNDLPNYSSLTPSISEFESQNSYFYKEYFELFFHKNEDEKENKK